MPFTINIRRRIGPARGSRADLAEPGPVTHFCEGTMSTERSTVGRGSEAGLLRRLCSGLAPVAWAVGLVGLGFAIGLPLFSRAPAPSVEVRHPSAGDHDIGVELPAPLPEGPDADDRTPGHDDAKRRARLPALIREYERRI